MSEKMILNKAFFGKSNCIKVMLNVQKECYIHWGWKNANEKYEWIKCKFSDTEIADIVSVLEGKKDSVAFYHTFNENSRQIWINRKQEAVFFKIKEMTKFLSEGEQKVLSLLLSHVVVQMSLAQ